MIVGASSPRAAASLVKGFARDRIDAKIYRRLDAVKVFGEDIDDLRERLRGDDRVAWIEAPHARTLFAISTSGFDSFSGREYGWAVESVSEGGASGQGQDALPVTVGIVDSGIDVTHADLAGRIGPTYDVLTGGTSVTDTVGHGTFVAGLISAIDGNGLGSRGVAGATTVLPIRITTNGAIKSTDAAEGIVEAVDMGAGVINLSFGGSVLSEVEKSALEYAAQKDVLVVAAAGNSYQVNNPVLYPAAAVGGYRGSWSSGLSVAATDPLGRHAPFSTANDFVSVAAPGAGAGQCGDGVFSTIPSNPTILWDIPGINGCSRVVGSYSYAAGRYGYGEGTSFAAPLVAGAAALVRSANPDLTAAQTADVIRRSARQTIGSGWNSHTGSGVLDVSAALALAGQYDTAPPVPSLKAVAAVGALSVTLSASDASPKGHASGVATYSLESSSDGLSYSTVVAPQSSPVQFSESLTPSHSRWYRGTVCDATRNCASAISGRLTAKAAAAPPATVRKLAPAVRPRVKALAAQRLRRCARCVRVRFTARGSGRVKWAITMRPVRAGVKAIRRTGIVPAKGRVVAKIPLSRVPVCRGRLVISIKLTSAFGRTKATRKLALKGACRKLPPRRKSTRR